MLLLPIALTLILGLAFGSVIIPETGKSVFHSLVPGIFALAGLFMIIPVAMSFSEGREQGLLKRINTTPTSSAEFMGSHL
ncbi:MAG: hypothetical protein ACW96X_06815, partial [Promethearchaeota archaeon]